MPPHEHARQGDSNDDNLVHDHIRRITLLETTVSNHSEIIASLIHMESHLKAIKWACCGAVAFYFVQRFGLLETLDKLLKLA